MNSTQLAPDSGGVAEQMLDLVPRLMRVISAAAQSSVDSMPLTVAQLRVLGLLARRRCLPGELARGLGVTPATLSEVVDILVRRGLVQRYHLAEDRRIMPLGITPAGQEACEAARRRALSALQRVLAGLEPQELAALKLGLESLAVLLPEKPSPPPEGARMLQQPREVGAD